MAQALTSLYPLQTELCDGLTCLRQTGRYPMTAGQKRGLQRMVLVEPGGQTKSLAGWMLAS